MAQLRRDKPAAFLSIDWGTSSFRAYLANCEGGVVDAIETSRGAVSLAAGEHAAYLEAALAPWRERAADLPIVMSGMVGSRQGWVEAAYVACPAGEAEIAAKVVAIPTAGFGTIRLIPGVSTHDADGAPDVMRGEEAQILGALQAGGARDGLYVLPGTHSKWATVANGRIVSFRTYMTGEIFAALKDHTILGRLMNAASGAAKTKDGFAAGVAASRRLERGGDLLHAVFMTRTLGLFDALPGDQLADYLSGLLIGAEILSGSEGRGSATVIASAALDARYLRAGAELGVDFRPAPPHCATLGHLAILRRLGGAP